MKQTPTVYELRTLMYWSAQAYFEGRWVPARPLGFFTIWPWMRFRAAWLVFTGQCDAVRWPEGQ